MTATKKRPKKTKSADNRNGKPEKAAAPSPISSRLRGLRSELTDRRNIEAEVKEDYTSAKAKTKAALNAFLTAFDAEMNAPEMPLLDGLDESLPVEANGEPEDEGEEEEDGE